MGLILYNGAEKLKDWGVQGKGLGLSWEDGFAFPHCGHPYSNLGGIKNFDPYRVIPVNNTPEEHRGRNRVRTYHVRSRQVTPVSEWREARALKH